MKKISYFFIVMSSLLMMTMTSCVNNLEGNEDNYPSNVATVQEQVSAMKSSVLELESIQTKLSEVSGFEEYVALVEDCATSVKEHIASVENGLSGADAAIAAMELQSQVAYAAGTVKVALALAGNDDFQKDMTALEKSVSAWLGKSFETYSDVLMGAYASQAAVEGAASQLSEHHGYVDAILSDVEAGLRSGVEAKELASVLETLANNLTSATELDSKVDEIILNLETECAMAVEALFDEPSSYDASTLKKASTQARIQLKSAEVTISDLVSRIVDIETNIDAIKTRISQLEADVNGLLGMIQSVTFLSEYSEEYVIAYYEMDNNSKVTAPGEPYDGKSLRTPVETIELNYMIRPASAAAAVTKDVVSVVGYYADKIQTKAIDPTKFVNFTVTDVSVTNEERGIVTVKMIHDLQNDFYYRETGAKCALFIATGQTDVASKFVELYPKDRSTTVYVESIKINQDAFEIDEGQTKNLTATVNPSSATNKTVTWTSSNTEIATIDQYSGVLTAVKQGNVTITATTNDINEWGDNLTASVNVKVNPSIRLGGPLYVEVGKTADLSLDFPPAMNIESKVWMSSDNTKATVENGVVTGVAHTYNEYTYQYNPITITCIVNGNITLTHEMSVVVPQPRQIRLNSYGDDVESVTMKPDKTISLAGSILPANVDASLFRLTYESDGGLGWIDFSSGEIKSPGSVGGRYVYIKVKDIDKHTYLKTFVERTVIVNVEPYYVESITLPATFEMNPQQTAPLLATFTSDVSGNQPTYRDLRWTSSDPTVVSVNETTGEMTSYKEGTVTITATTTHANAVPSGQPQKSASCVVTVKTPVAPIAIGDYFYNDGTWSTERDNSKTVIGIVFATVNPAGADTHLRADYPTCTNGLVVSTVEYTSACNTGREWSLVDMANWCYSNGYTSYWDQSNTCGYSNTKGYIAVNAANIDSWGYTIDFTLFNSTSPVVTHRNSVSVPTSTSAWYVPSYKEMQLLYENRAIVNERITAVGGTGLHVRQINYDDNQYRYWTSTNDFEQKIIRTFDMRDSGGGAWYSATGGETTSFPVRVILAF